MTNPLPKSFTLDEVPRALTEILDALQRVVTEDDARSAGSRSCASGAAKLAPRLAWVHRTGGATDWRRLFETRRLRAESSGTSYERALGLERAVYFFVGACAFPTGTLALVMAPFAARPDASTFTPYDTGALKKHLILADRSLPWDDDAKTQHLREHLGGGADAGAFLGPYLAAHFRDPLDYVRAGQHASPDFAPYHGLRSGTQDRRAWTVETRVHEDVDVAPGGEFLEEIWFEDHDLVNELPDDFKGIARVIPDGVRLESAVAQSIEARFRRADE